MIKLIATRSCVRKDKRTKKPLPFHRFGIELTSNDARTLLTEKKEHTYYEYLTDDAITKVYLDKDIHIEPELVDFELPKHNQAVRAKLDELLSFICNETKLVNGSIGYNIATRHGATATAYKLSFRPYIYGVRIRYLDILKLLENVGQEEYWDTSVYYHNSLLAAINGKKEGAETLRVLVPENPTDEPLLYVAQYTDPSWPLLVPGEPQKSAKASQDPAFDVYDVDEMVEEISKAMMEETMLHKYLGIVAPPMSMFNDICADLNKSTVNMYITERVHCPIANKAHKSNNSSLSIYLPRVKRYGIQVCYHCLDPECRSEDKFVDVRKHVSNKFIDLIESYRVIPTTSTPVSSTPQCDSPMDNGLVSKRAASVSSPQCMDDSSKLKEELCNKWSDIFNGLDDVPFYLTHGNDNKVSFTWGTLSGTILPNTSVMMKDGKFLGMLVPDHVVKGPFTHIDKNIPIKLLECRYNQTSEDKSVLKSSTDDIDMEITLHNEEDCKLVHVAQRGEKDFCITNKGKIQDLQKMIRNASQKHIEKVLGPNFTNYFQINIINNGGNIIIGNSEASHEKQVNPEEIVQVALENHAEVFDRMCFVPELKSNNCNGIYYCDDITNIWSRRTNPEMEQLLINTLRYDSDLTEKQIRHLSTRRGRNDILYCVACKKINRNFADVLNSNVNLFPCNNGVFDMTTKTFRMIEPEDYIKVTCGWRHCPEEARNHRADVKRFLEQLFPDEKERNAVLAFVASLMSGDRKMKKFIIMTDKREGDNGKSTFIAFLKQFFGDFATERGKKILSKATMEADRNSHDAGLESLRGLRLIIGDEFSRDTRLDTGFIKWLTSGSNVTLEGRACGSEERFAFTFQAGIILIFNETECPKFNVDDEAFNKRILVAPMRSRFVENAHLASEPNTYEVDRNYARKMHKWRSSFAEILLEHYDPSGGLDVPESMSDWQNDMATENNALAGFLDDTIEITGDPTDYILREDVLLRYCGQPLKKTEMNGLYKAHFKRKTMVKYVDKADFKGRKNVRGIVYGAHMKEAIDI